MKHPRILIPPGIGDAYWVIVKLPAFLEREELAKPELTILSYECPKGSHLRSLPYLQQFPHLFTIGEPAFVPNDPNLQAIWDEAYLKRGFSVFQNVQGFDYFMAYNGRINSGSWIEADELACNWYPAMKDQPQQYVEGFRKQFGPFAALFWPFYGSYESHRTQFPIDQIAVALNSFFEKTGLTPVFIGADWDIGLNEPVQQLIQAIPGAVDYIGKTSLMESFGLLMAADLVTGYHAGLTNMAAVFGTKTLLLWDDRYPASTSYACVPPASRGTNYLALPTKDLTASAYLAALLRLHAKHIL